MQVVDLGDLHPLVPRPWRLRRSCSERLGSHLHQDSERPPLVPRRGSGGHAVDLVGGRLDAGIHFRHGATAVDRWELERGAESLTVAVSGPLIVDDVEPLIRAAIDGVGLAFASEERVASHLARGVLVRVLEDGCPPFDGHDL